MVNYSFFRFFSPVILALVWLMAGAALLQPAYAATLTVTNTNDSGPGSLRAALVAATAGSVIQFNLPANSTITLTGGELVVNAPVTIDGATATNLTISGNNAGRAFLASTALTITALTIRDGNASGGNGGGIASTGAMTLTLTNVKVISNTATEGGGVWANGAIRLNGGLFQNNISVNGLGGGLFTSGSLTLTGTQFIGNRAQKGGGLYQTGNGAGQIINALFVRNTASGGSALDLNSTASVAVMHSTIIGPKVAVPTVNDLKDIGVYPQTRFDTFTGVVAAGGSVGITNTIVASYSIGISYTIGTAWENYNLFSGNDVNLTGTITSGGNSFSGNPMFANPTGNDYHLGPGSAAINAGVNLGVLTDFEGEPRPSGGGFDIGFDEYPFQSVYLPLIRR
ncbi:MAG: choice-of-anchor Q domain-containing protein [Anaerolineae bacterium]